MIKRAGAPVLFLRKKSRKWGIYRPARINHIKEATQIELLTDAVLKELGIRIL
jgi:hypothetical protein